MIKVLNIAQFIPIEGIQVDNDISLKIYSDLQKEFGIDSEFVKPVGNAPRWIGYFRSSSRTRRDFFSRTDYFDRKYNIRIHFYKGSFPLINRAPFKTDFLLPIEFKFYKKFLVDIISTYKPELVHAHSFNPDSYYALELYKRFRIPYILTLRGSYSKVYSTKRGKEILKHASLITSPNYVLWSILNRDYDIKLVPHGIDEHWFTDRKRSFNPEKLRLVTVSRLLEMKNIQTVLRAIAKLNIEGYRITYDIIGDGDYRERLEKLTNELELNEFVRFHGFQNAEYIRGVYKNSDIFVLLSYPETFGLSYFEAAAQGLYLIGVKNTGAYGHFNDSEARFIDVDEVQLIESLKMIDKNDFNLKTSGMQLKINNFQNKKIIDKYYKIISEIV